MKTLILRQYLTSWDDDGITVEVIGNTEVVGIEIRIPTTKVRESDRAEFDRIAAITRSYSNGTIHFISTLEEYRSGIVSLKVNAQNNAYSNKKECRVIDRLVNDLIPR